ncbi:MAG TPA: hypothetical protein VGM21_04015 [Actinomycetota bacterium]
MRPAENDGRRAREPGATFTPTTASPLHEQRSARIVTHQGDDPAARLLELAGEYVQGVLADVDVIVSKAAARAREIPDRPELARQVAAMWTVLGEALMRVAVLEKDLEERDAERRRQHKR